MSNSEQPKNHPGPQTEISDEQKNRVDAIELLRSAAWDSVKSRRSFEWQIGIAVWTAFAAFIGIRIGSKDTTSSVTFEWLVAVSSIIVLLHWWWIWGISRAHQFDKENEQMFREAMMGELFLSYTDTNKRRLSHIKSLGKFRMSHFLRNQWNRAFQGGITLILAAAASLVTLRGQAVHQQFHAYHGDAVQLAKQLDHLGEWEPAFPPSSTVTEQGPEVFIIVKAPK